MLQRDSTAFTIRFTLEELSEDELPDPKDVEIYRFNSITVEDDGGGYG